jgi:hypothetical protein
LNRRPESRRTQWALGAIAVIGLALTLAPVAFNMFERAPKGATMLVEFRPFMTTSRLDGYQAEIREIDAAVRETDTSVSPYLLAHGFDRAELRSRFPYFTALSAKWPSIDSTMTVLMDKVQANLGNYDAVAALPSFTLFPWFFVVPGILLMALAVLAWIRPGWRRRLRWGVVAVGIGLVLAPVAFQMFQRAPAGGHMMAAFRTIETPTNVERIQDDFSTMAVGQGDIRLGFVPALERSGLTQSEIAGDFPALTALDRDWVHTLNDMTPMIGAMSNAVPEYQAIASLPSFALFPWFFALPGVLVIAAALCVRTRRDSE